MKKKWQNIYLKFRDFSQKIIKKEMLKARKEFTKLQHISE